ncbi:hypothetical protein DM02DRAFT_529029 [Periconia macrospinosa]|uniref:Zn(2)-C6 fungal-type domain-containing protein n=1 Tax=Periconia macrospinosa TaxID=97972 RepID=A0A2V1DN41_9PLEO|nr:hypothetical protein DM02DRAFT_529029 [Periconia macrospinosa]
MVYRGKPSKACQRCRERKLRCDLQRPHCNSCLRAGVRCYGYRDTESLRIENETQSVRSKPKLLKGNTYPTVTRPKNVNLSHLPLDLQVQARELFIEYYIQDFSRAWDFLNPYLNSNDIPEHVRLGIDAASLAFLSHHVTSPSAANLGRLKYVSALQKTNAVLQCTNAAQETSTLDATLLLDLFEKILNSGGAAREKSQRAHIEGSLALVKLRGLNNFTDEAGVKKLYRLTINTMISCVSLGSPVPSELFKIREHLSHFMNTKDPKFRSVGVIFNTTTPGEELSQSLPDPWENIERCASLDEQLETISLEASPTWYVFWVDLHYSSERVLDDFYDVYDSRMTTQMWNALRVSRLLLCEEILESLPACQSEKSVRAAQRATAAMDELIKEICASVPQMTDCKNAAKSKLPPNADACISFHGHTVSHFLDNYILLYALYVAGWSRGCQTRQRAWIIKQLIHIGDHFRVKEAALVANILQNQTKNAMSEKPRPWDIYRLLGSYAFAA